MGVGNAFQTNIFGEMVSLLQGLVNLLLAYRVLGQLITAAQQAADNYNFRQSSKNASA